VINYTRFAKKVSNDAQNVQATLSDGVLLPDMLPPISEHWTKHEKIEASHNFVGGTTEFIRAKNHFWGAGAAGSCLFYYAYHKMIAAKNGVC